VVGIFAPLMFAGDVVPFRRLLFADEMWKQRGSVRPAFRRSRAAMRAFYRAFGARFCGNANVPPLSFCGMIVTTLPRQGQFNVYC
jgi:hypothetical protein